MNPSSPSGSIEHRLETRFRHLLPVHVGSVEMSTANVSLHGMQLVCPVRPFSRIKADVNRGELNAMVAVGEPFRAALSVCYVSPHRDEMLIGVRIGVPDEFAEARWVAFIEGLSKLKSKVDKPKP